MRRFTFIVGLLLCTLMVIGCVQTQSPVVAKTTVIVTTLPDTSIPAPSPEITPRYHTGDIVDGTQNIDRTPHLIILDYNKTSGEYDYDIIFRNANKSWGYRIYPEHRYMPVAEFEKNASYLLTHINMTDLATWFPTKEIFEKTP
jgi:hypothetical protein